MRPIHRSPSPLAPMIGLLAAVAVSAAGEALTPEEDTMTVARATGTFEVTRTPEWTEGEAGTVTLGRDRLDKRFDGDLEGTGSGTMLTALAPVQGSAGYVAIERFTGTLHGRAGSFVLQHNGILTRSEPHLTIAIVPDSGTGELEGIAGTMTIAVEHGRHSFELEYTLP